MKKLLVKIGLWIARLGGYKEYNEFTDSQIATAVTIVSQVEAKFKDQSGFFKRNQAMRAMLNIGWTERFSNKIIEFVLEKYI